MDAAQLASEVETATNVANRWTKRFLLTVAVILAITSLAKIVSSFGHAKVLDAEDPIFRLRYRYVMMAAGILEMLVAVHSATTRRATYGLTLVAWLATCFVVYRLALLWIGFQLPCHCLGSLTDALHLSGQAAERGTRITLAYLFVGSYASLLWLWMTKQLRDPATPAI